MPLPDLSQIPKGCGKIITSLFTGKTRCVNLKARKVSPHIQAIAGFVVKNAVKKMDYAEDLTFLVNNGMSVKKAAQALGISSSYAYKLLKKK